MQNKKLYIASAAATSFLWGIDAIFVQAVVGEINPQFTSFLKSSIATLFFIIIYICRTKSAKVSAGGIMTPGRIEKKDLPLCAVAGILGMGLYFLFENSGIKYTSGALSALILAALPIVGIIGDRIFFKSRITGVKIVGTVLSLTGVALVVTGGSPEALEGQLKGYFLMFMAMLCMAGAAFASKTLYRKYSVLTVLTYSCSFGAVSLLPAALLYFPGSDAFSLKTIALVVCMSLFCTVGAEFFNAFSLSGLPVTLVTLFGNLIPVVSVAAAYIAFHEIPGPRQLIGGAVIVAAISLVSLTSKASGPQA
ncbi:MAG: DMT family transporter [Clostridia bacterium]|nr:DMT family transporter [Clostridia bacterium]